MLKKILKIFAVILLIVFLISGGTYLYITQDFPLRGSFITGRQDIARNFELRERGQEFSVMSFNIRLITKEEEEGHNWDRRKEPMIDLIKKYDADIIGFQEVTYPQYRYLIQELGEDYAYYGIFRSGMDLERGAQVMGKTAGMPKLLSSFAIWLVDEASPLFFRKARFELLDFETFWLSENPQNVGRGWDAAIRRICSYVRLKDHYSGESITVYNTHFDHKGHEAKLNSIALIYRHADKWGQRPVVMGDFNFPEKGDIYDKMVSRSFADVKYAAPEDKQDDGPTFNGFGKYGYEEPIDFIFTGEEAYNILSYKVIKERYDDKHYISDHYPVFARLSYK